MAFLLVQLIPRSIHSRSTGTSPVPATKRPLYLRRGPPPPTGLPPPHCWKLYMVAQTHPDGPHAARKVVADQQPNEQRSHPAVGFGRRSSRAVRQPGDQHRHHMVAIEAARGKAQGAAATRCSHRQGDAARRPPAHPHPQPRRHHVGACRAVQPAPQAAKGLPAEAQA